jgi:2-polyprenyl-6-methoxyphenol hydroxylase-like FAD-dependent oxidoreductase
MADVPVLIVGAGPTGLVLALWLNRLGVAVRIIDKTAEAGTTSRALAVQARTLELYHQVGIADAVIDGGVKIAHLNFWVHGTRAASVPLRRIGEGLSPYPFALVFPQDAHERLLIEQLEMRGIKVERQTELLHLEQNDGRGDPANPGGVRATLRLPDGSEESCNAAYLAGCDGASSTVREALGVGFPGGTYTGMFYVADVKATGPAINDELHADLEDADFVLVFPLKGKNHARLVGTVHKLPTDDHKLTFDDVKSRAIENLKLDIEEVNWFSTYRVHHRVAHHFRVGRAFLLGDAGHIHSPVGGQGMNTGIGDAINLAWKLAAVLNDGAPVKLLDTYEAERIPFARRLVATTDRIFTLVTNRSAIAGFVRIRIVPLVMPLLFSLQAVRHFLFRTVSQIGVNYRGSWLSDGKAGSIHSGDRLPWVETGTGKDNFAPLTSLDWQVHVYGEVPTGADEVCRELCLPLHHFEWRPEMRQSKLRRGPIYLIRPDTYVALADPQGDPARLRRYFADRGLRVNSPHRTSSSVEQ